MENQIEEITQFLPIYVVLLSNSKLLSPVFGEVRSSKFEVQACRSSEVSRLGFQFLGRFGVQISVSKYHWFEKFEVRSYRSLECCSRFGFRFLRRFGFLLCQNSINYHSNLAVCSRFGHVEVQRVQGLLIERVQGSDFCAIFPCGPSSSKM